MIRPATLSPTLARLAGLVPGARAGFSLVELIAALALSVVIVLMVASAYRLVAQAITQVNTWSTENQLLRTGFIQALDDADFWHSHANADAPYEKDFQRERTTTTDNRRKRPFQPVRFAAATAASDASNAPGLANHGGLLVNPNVFLPNDPRAWYRHRMLPNARPAGVRDNGSEGARDWSCVAGWTPAQIYGDYGLTAATDMPGSPRFPALAGLDVRQNQARPRAMWEIFQYLGLIGVAEYMPPDCPWLMFGPDGRMPHAGSAPTAGFVASTHHFTYAGFLDRASWSQNGAGDFTSHLGAAFQRGEANQFAFTIQPFAGELSGEFDGDVRNADVWANGLILNGGGEARYLAFPYHGKWATATAHTEDFQTATVRAPYNLTDAVRPSWWNGTSWKPFQQTLDYTSKPARMPVLSTAMVRFHEFAGGNLAAHWVRLENPETGKLIELGFTTTSTTWRGARQHWRLDPRWPTAASPDAIGDYYE